MRFFLAIFFVLASNTLLIKESIAKVYKYVDKHGVIHFTNKTRSPKAAPKSLEQESSLHLDWLPELNIDPSLGSSLYNIDIYDQLILEAAKYYLLPPALVKAVIAVESAFNPLAISPAGAEGLMQLMPETAELMYVKDTFDPRENIYGGCRYLRIVANRFAGNLHFTLAGYNAGPERVVAARGIPNISETKQYIKRVLNLYNYYLFNWRLSNS